MTEYDKIREQVMKPIAIRVIESKMTHANGGPYSNFKGRTPMSLVSFATHDYKNTDK